MEQWKNSTNQMTDGQVRSVLENLGLEIQSETDTNYMVLCPFHMNVHSAALSVSKESGVFHCFGAGCGESGNLVQLIRKVKGVNYFGSLRFIEKYRGEEVSLEEKLKKITEDKDIARFPQEIVDGLEEKFWEYDKPKRYMNSRGITNSTSKYFHMGYDPQKDMVCVPVYDRDGNSVGLVGRCIEYKRFKNSNNLPTSKTLFNYHNARKMNNDYVILVESSFDAMRVWQATGKAVVATLGGTFSDSHCAQIFRSFNGVILGVDNDEAGQKFAKRISKKCRAHGLIMKQARYSETQLFPDRAKDFGDCTDEQIAHMVDNACAFV